MNRSSILKFLMLPLFLVGLISFSCSKNNESEETLPPIQEPPPVEVRDSIVNDITLDRTGPLKGKLAKEGMCRSYTITVTGGNIDMDLIHSIWTNPFSKIKYKYSFGVANFCDFKEVKEGQSFYFEIISSGNTDCINCAAWYPSPEKKLNIKVLEVIP